MQGKLSSDTQFETWVDTAKERVLETCGFLCGIIREKEDSMMADIKYINDETLASLHEDRMMRMLICDTVMYSKAWNDFSLVLSSVKNQISEEIESDLILDLIKDINY